MPIIFDEVTASITSPAPTPETDEPRPDAPDASRLDPQALVRQLQLIAERAERLNAD